MGILGPPTKEETGMEGVRNDSNSGHQHLGGDEKEKKEKPHCITSCWGLWFSKFVARKAPREPETALLSLVFLRKQ